MAMDPQPQPTSSRRAPACSCKPNLRQTSSCLASCDSSSIASQRMPPAAQARFFGWRRQWLTECTNLLGSDDGRGQDLPRSSWVGDVRLGVAECHHEIEEIAIEVDV